MVCLAGHSALANKRALSYEKLPEEVNGGKHMIRITTMKRTRDKVAMIMASGKIAIQEVVVGTQ